MSFGKFMMIPLFVAFQAFTMMVIAPFIPGADKALLGGGALITWIAFQAWAMYFLAGCTPKMAGKTFAGYVGGIIASIAIFELGFKVFGGLNGATPWGLYLAVFLVVIPVIAMEKVPGMDFIPSYFIGAGAFFALMTHGGKPEGMGAYSWYGTAALGELIACAIGLLYGWVTVTVRVWYTNKVTAPACACDCSCAAEPVAEK